MNPSDAELMRRWQQGDAVAFEVLVRRWQEPVGRFLVRLVGRAGPVPDLCQDVFLRLFHAGPHYREEGAFSTWLYRIALNVARDAGRRARPLAPLNGHEPPDGQARAEEVCQSRESAGLVTRALEELPGPLREVLVLRHYEGLNFEQIARLTGTPASTVKSRFAAALQRLRVRLHELGWGPEETEP